MCEREETTKATNNERVKTQMNMEIDVTIVIHIPTIE